MHKVQILSAQRHFDSRRFIFILHAKSTNNILHSLDIYPTPDWFAFKCICSSLILDFPKKKMSKQIDDRMLTFDFSAGISVNPFVSPRYAEAPRTEFMSFRVNRICQRLFVCLMSFLNFCLPAIQPNDLWIAFFGCVLVVGRWSFVDCRTFICALPSSNAKWACYFINEAAWAGRTWQEWLKTSLAFEARANARTLPHTQSNASQAKRKRTTNIFMTEIHIIFHYVGRWGQQYHKNTIKLSFFLSVFSYAVACARTE